MSKFIYLDKIFFPLLMNNYAFIDAQNLHFGISKNIKNKKGKTVYQGWFLDLKLFLQYLKKHYQVKKAYLFMGHLPENESMYQMFKSFGYDIVFKEVIKDSTGKPKGNVDSELVVQALGYDYDNYEKAVIVSGDGDFACLVKYLKENKKFHVVLAPHRVKCSRLLRKQAKKQINFLNDFKDELEQK